MTCDIFIKSYIPDLHWLAYALRSIAKFSNGFRRTVVALPPDHGLNLTQEHVVICPGPESYLYQQVCKLNADLRTDADFILHFDSDMILTKPVSPEFFFKDGKPIWVITPWGVLSEDEKKAWMHVMVKALREFPPYEFMRKCAVMVPRWLYAEFRAHMEKLHGFSMEAYVMNQPGHEFSEYNCLGFYAWLYHRDKFYWHDTTVDGVPKWPFQQRWSWGGLTQEIKNELEIALA